MTTYYTTFNEAVQREIIEPIEAGDATRDDFDIETIADETIVYCSRGYYLDDDLDHDEFWSIVWENMQ